jgi:hypothetical protein
MHGGYNVSILLCTIARNDLCGTPQLVYTVKK